MNKVILLGRLGKDPHISGEVTRFSLATSERRKDTNGAWTDHTEWHNVVTFGTTAQNCAKYLTKGAQTLVEGKLSTRKWTDKQGVERYSTDVVALNVQFLNRSESRAEAPAAPARPYSEPTTFDDDDIPF